MIPRECKRLAEVDFPIAAVSRQAVREKLIRHGHPSTLHLWWARRPLAACRAILLALLLPDPCDSQCPEGFKAAARKMLLGILGRAGPNDEDLRESLLRFIGEFANWNNATSTAFLEVARGLIKAAYPEDTPLVVDPFAGGGSIPLEALRLGCDTFASDLNPVACLILKTLLEEIPRHSVGLSDEVLEAGAQIKKEAEKQLATLYPPDPDGAQPIAFIWARTVRCESPNCGAEIPLARSFWLSKKPDRRRALRYTIDRVKGKVPKVVFEIFSPKRDDEVPKGTVSRATAVCPCCQTPLLPNRVTAQLKEQRGGADVKFDAEGHRIGGTVMLAVVGLHPSEQARRYRLPNARDYAAVWAATSQLQETVAAHNEELSLIPDEPLPPQGTLGFRVQRYGMTTWGDLFSARQKLALLVLCGGVREHAGDSAVQLCLANVVDRTASRMSSLSTWRYQADQEKVEHTFTRQALPFVWDFAEAVATSSSTGSWEDGVGVIAQMIKERQAWTGGSAQVNQQDARHSLLPSDTASVWFTDPPYYDAVPYADLSDFFFVWLKRALPNNPLLRDLGDISNPLTPKAAEIVQDETKNVEGRPKDHEFFEDAMARAFAEGRRVTKEDGIGSVVFAHKTTEGWEALLSGLTRGGWTITGSWPIATEMRTRLRARESAALATSVHLICRPRLEHRIGDWGEILGELPNRVAHWMARLEREGVHGADLVFACIGPALEIFSRYSRVETPDGREIALPHFLERVWEVVGRAALEQVLGTAEAQARNGGLGALEEDSRLTAIFLWTLGAASRDNEASSSADSIEEADEQDDEDDEGTSKKVKGLTLIYDIVRRFAQPLGIHLDAWKGRIIDIDKGVVRLLPVTDRSMQLFGEAGADAIASAIENDPRKAAQLELFPAVETETPKIKGRGRKKTGSSAPTAYTGQITTLDRVHAAMLLQRQGRTNALRSLLAAEAQRGPDFRRLANALSALYPQASEEKRLLDAMLLAMPRR